MRLAHGLVLASLLASCGGASAPAAGPTTPAAAGATHAVPEPAPATDEDALAAQRRLRELDGRYPTERFTLVENGCGSEFSNNVPVVVVDADAAVLYTEGEQRHYDARVEGDELVADAWFGSDAGSGLCRESRFHERWRFRRRPDGGLSGFVEGLWPLEPDHCMQPCRVRFSVEARPSDGPGDAPPRPPPRPRARDERG